MENCFIKEGATPIDDESDFDDEIILGSLQYLSIHYMKYMESICKWGVCAI